MANHEPRLTADTVESPLPRDRHGGFGERSGETEQEQSRHRAPGLLSDEAGHTLRPPKARTWAPRGQTPVIPVTGKGSGRISVAGLFCVHPDSNSAERIHLLYRIKIHRKRKGERTSFAETDYAALLDAAHQYL